MRWEIHRGALDVLRFLLIKWERDVAWLTDYRTREEQDRRLLYGEVALKRHLIDQNWSLLSAAMIAFAYKRTLAYRLANPKAFSPEPEVHDQSRPPASSSGTQH